MPGLGNLNVVYMAGGLLGVFYLFPILLFWGINVMLQFLKLL